MNSDFSNSELQKIDDDLGKFQEKLLNELREIIKDQLSSSISGSAIEKSQDVLSRIESVVRDVQVQEKTISLLSKRIDDVHPTIRSNIDSFSEATNSYRQISKDLREDVKELRESIKNLVTKQELESCLNRFKVNLPGKWEIRGLLLGVLVTCIASIASTLSFVPVQLQLLEELEEVKNASKDNELNTPLETSDFFETTKFSGSSKVVMKK